MPNKYQFSVFLPMMKLPIALCLVIVFTFSPMYSRGQTQFSGWLASFNTIKVNKKFGVAADAQLRSADQLKHVQILLIRPGVNFMLTKQLTLSAGYAYVQNRRVVGSISGYAVEHRSWEQLLFTHKLSVLSVTHRLRLEQRFIPRVAVVNNEIRKSGTLHANRVRYFIRNLLPLNTRQTPFTRGLFAALQNEVFLNIGNKANVNGKTFDQNRLYLAMGYRINKRFDLETGYLNQYIQGSSAAGTRNHVVQLATYLRM
jgi:Protein of unknown function (DUF2490)